MKNVKIICSVTLIRLHLLTSLTILATLTIMPMYLLGSVANDRVVAGASAFELGALGFVLQIIIGMVAVAIAPTLITRMMIY